MAALLHNSYTLRLLQWFKGIWRLELMGSPYVSQVTWTPPFRVCMPSLAREKNSEMEILPVCHISKLEKHCIRISHKRSQRITTSNSWERGREGTSSKKGPQCEGFNVRSTICTGCYKPPSHHHNSYFNYFQ